MTDSTDGAGDDTDTADSLDIEAHREWLNDEFALTAERAQEHGISFEEYAYFVTVYAQRLRAELDDAGTVTIPEESQTHD